jgi:LPXTG-motif cell wall-anchored protein
MRASIDLYKQGQMRRGSFTHLNFSYFMSTSTGDQKSSVYIIAGAIIFAGLLVLAAASPSRKLSLTNFWTRDVKA